MADLPCFHPRIETQVNTTYLTDSGKYAADIRIACADCGEPFAFPSHLPVGVDLSGVARSLDGTELRIAILPQSTSALDALSERPSDG